VLRESCPVLTSLIVMADAKIGTVCFKNVMGYMGDRHYDAPVLVAKELLQMARDNEVRMRTLYRDHALEST